MIVTEAELRDQLRRPSAGAQVSIPAGARLSPSAADFVKEWSLAVVEGTPAEPDERAAVDPASLDWEKASVFPVDFSGELPRCTTCGTSVTEKASALTQLNAHHYAPKNHPRIRLRGRVDSLHSMIMLIQRIARQRDEAGLARDLGTIAAYCRELTSAEYNERPVAELALREWDAERIHQVTHDPRGTLGIEHLTLDDEDDELLHWLNLARSTAREIEITAMDAFGSPHHPFGASICHALNRLSSSLYFLQLLMKAEASR